MTRKQHIFLKILVLVFLLSGCIPVPEVEKRKDKYVIAPGKGIQEITLGKSPSAIFEIMGEPENRTTFAEEYAAYASSGFNPDTQLEFILGFDVCFEYSMEQNRSTYPIYKIFFQQDKIHAMMFSAFLYSSESLQNIFIASEELQFYSNIEDIKRVLGTDYIYHPLAISSYDQETGNFVLIENYEIYDYLEKGISVIVENNKIVSVQIYPPEFSDRKRQYKEKILDSAHP